MQNAMMLDVELIKKKEQKYLDKKICTLIANVWVG